MADSRYWKMVGSACRTHVVLDRVYELAVSLPIN